jgi:hypothetical protein
MEQRTVSQSAMAPSATPRHFVAHSLMGTPKHAQFHSGRFRRTYVCYAGDDFLVRVICYDHDSGQWGEPVRVDDMRMHEGHKSPRMVITHNGHLHLFYGCHHDPIRYARSLYPEDITRWQLGKEIGVRETYPTPVCLANDEILVFCRFGRRFPDCPLRVFRSSDNGTTWDEGTDLVEAKGVVRPCDVVYDAAENLVYIAVRDCGAYRVPPGREPAEFREAEWLPYALRYDPVAREVLAMNDVCLGPAVTKDQLAANDSQGWWGFARWGSDRVLNLGRSEHRYHNAAMHTTDGQTIRWYGIVPTGEQVEFAQYGEQRAGSDLVVRTSTDSGQTWDAGRVVVSRQALGDVPNGIQRVHGFRGGGPLLVFQGLGAHATEEFMFRWRVRHQCHTEPITMSWKVLFPWKSVHWHGRWKSWNNYNRPIRTRQRLYALDANHEFVAPSPLA